jgi:hypothetical protein
MFPEKIIDAVYELRRHYKGSRTCVSMNFPIVEILISHKDREMSVKLFYFPNTSTFEIQPMDSKVFQKISFYDYTKNERRWIRNKSLLFSVITNLKRCGLWEYVSNKDFLTVNDNNKKVGVSERASALQKMVN